MFKRIPILIKIFKNKLDVTRLDTSQTIIKDFYDNHFSTDRMCVANFTVLEQSVSKIIDELNPPLIGFLRSSLESVIQICELNNNDLSQVEIRSLNDLCEIIGTSNKHTYVELKSTPLTNQEALNIIDKS